MGVGQVIGPGSGRVCECAGVEWVRSGQMWGFGQEVVRECDR